MLRNHSLEDLQSAKKRTGKSRPEFKGENMKNMFIALNDNAEKMLSQMRQAVPLVRVLAQINYAAVSTPKKPPDCLLQKPA